MSGSGGSGAGLTRRHLLGGVVGGLAGLGTLGTATAVAPRLAPAVGPSPVSMAMHLHGSFSEGAASMHAHLQQAARVGVDVLWWTDHDFRQSAQGYRNAVGFDGPVEFELGHRWDWSVYARDGLASSQHTFVDNPHSPDEAGGAMQLEATAQAGSSWGTYLVFGEAWNFTYSTSYADTTLQLDVLPQVAGPNVGVVIEIGSSYRPASGGRAAGQYRLQYRINAGGAARWTEDNGRLGIVQVPVQQVGQWQRVQMDLADDHAALWPDTVAGDASLKQFRVGVRARSGATARAVVDRLRFVRGRQTPADGHALLNSVVAEYRQRYPGLTQFAAAEISLVNHLNAFGGDGTLPTYGGDTSLIKDGSTEAQREMVRFLNDHGAAVCINHPTAGNVSVQQLARTLVTTDGLGADAIEIGIGQQAVSLARPFDIAARNAVFLTATGVTDDHAGMDWLSPTSRRWLTSVWAVGRTEGALTAATKAGRAWFWDPLYWRGELDLLVNGKAPMGGVLVTKDKRVAVKVTATDIPAGGSVAFIVGRCDRAGVSDLQPINNTRVVPKRDFHAGQWSTQVDRGTGVYIRATVRTQSGRVVGFSNPTWVLPSGVGDEITIPADRRYP